mmetsp:Transcript_13918/g.20643  ORF Transcript_13918/g.20643 Transcript_13918/m.20643 type:complete len:220 (-) Transcript_13918:87-746(-)|eukprot:CAMPEP_0171456734 /NCGR_PEP_ID=MMETSP0945-20130129/3097_1 /TAXON_ID=109269 /ORGANISM="Vaucheria litorea, Strain CCMP2940" /LENGTH=219 /DNA_ID=CAMNT_0011982207 /DNA_START=26 /DNA_END=685 /DNA_ORIENTATION=-
MRRMLLILLILPAVSPFLTPRGQSAVKSSLNSSPSMGEDFFWTLHNNLNQNFVECEWNPYGSESARPERIEKSLESHSNHDSSDDARIKRINARRLRWFNANIDRCGKEGRVDDALELVQDMFTAGIEPEGITLLILAMACLKGRRYESAHSILEVMREHCMDHPALDLYFDAFGESIVSQNEKRADFLIEDARRSVVYPHELRSIVKEKSLIDDSEYI